MKKNILIIEKIILTVLTLVYPFFTVMLSGAGLILNGNSYGTKIIICGIIWIFSGLLMSSGSIFCIANKNIPAVILSSIGFLTCMIILFIVISHAEKHGWNAPLPLFDEFSVAYMYGRRIIPTVIPFILTILISGKKLCIK